MSLVLALSSRSLPNATKTCWRLSSTSTATGSRSSWKRCSAYFSNNSTSEEPTSTSSAQEVSSSSPSAAVQTLHYLPTVKAKCFIPRSERSPTNPMFEFDPYYDDRLKRRDRRDPTRELNYTSVHWHRHQSVWRRMRHVATTFGSSPLQRLLFPDLFWVALVTGGVTYYNEFLTGCEAIKPSFVGGTTAIGILAAFRLNASYARYEEGRRLWGEVNNACRDLAGNSLMWLQGDPIQQQRMLRLIQAFPVALHWHINVKGGHYKLVRKDPNFTEQLYSEYYLEFSDIFQKQNKRGETKEQDPDFLAICNCYRDRGHVPLLIVSKMREIIADQNAFVTTTTDIDEHHQALANIPIYARGLDDQIQRLVGALGACERILRTPIPTCFTRHTSRLNFVWSTLLPFAMYPSFGPFWTMPSALLVTFALTGIDDISVQIEEPFNILPLRQYAEGVYDGVNSIQSSYNNKY